MTHACEVANVGERNSGSRRPSILNELFDAAQLKEMEAGKLGFGLGSGSGYGRWSEIVAQWKKKKGKEVSPH